MLRPSGKSDISEIQKKEVWPMICKEKKKIKLNIKCYCIPFSFILLARALNYRPSAGRFFLNVCFLFKKICFHCFVTSFTSLESIHMGIEIFRIFCCAFGWTINHETNRDGGCSNYRLLFFKPPSASSSLISTRQLKSLIDSNFIHKCLSFHFEATESKLCLSIFYGDARR